LENKNRVTNKDMEVLNTDHQKKYRSAVGKLLYSTKYSWPDINNLVKELSIFMDGVTLGAHHDMIRVIRSVINMD
jgi:hypothetical protein